MCLHPRIIINPMLPELMAKHRCLMFGTRLINVENSYRLLYQFDWSKFSVMGKGINKENYRDYVVVDKETGEFFNVYMEVPCGKCELCKNSKVNSFVERCRMETQLYDNQPWFVTLTYDNEHLPIDGLSVRDVQLFLKRFRITLQRKGYGDAVRYCVVGEYGKKGRAHYHMILWNIKTYTPEAYEKVGTILRDTWKNGFVQHRLIDAKDDKAFYYTAKYLRKDVVVPFGCNGTFCCSSRRNGGIGARFIDRCTSAIRRTLNINYQYLDKFTQKLRPFLWYPYMVKRIFPSFCRKVPKLFRDALRDFSCYMSLAYHRYSHTKVYETFREQYEDLYARYHKEFFMPWMKFKEIPNYMRIHIKDLWCRLAECSRICQVYATQFKSFAPFRKVEAQRDAFMSKLTRYDREVDMDLRLNMIRKMTARSRALLVLD